MSRTRHGTIVFERGSNHDQFLACDPTPEIVLEEMQKNIEQKSLSELELSLLHYESKTRRGEPKSELTLSLAFHRCLPPGWVVTYSRPIDDVLDFLATSNRDDARLTRRTWCGDISDFRRQCIHNDPDILRRAISWFLEHYGPCPDFAWIPYEEAVLDLDDS